MQWIATCKSKRRDRKGTIMDILNYIIEKALILIPVLIIIGWIFKQTPKFPDWCIPWALLVLGIVGAGFWIGWTPEGVFQGILVAGTAVFGNQLYKQTLNHSDGVDAPTNPDNPA